MLVVANVFGVVLPSLDVLTVNAASERGLSLIVDPNPGDLTMTRMKLW